MSPPAPWRAAAPSRATCRSAPGLFSPAILALIRLVIARDELRARLRAATGSRIPLLSESTAMATGYLAAERDLGRVAAGADIGTLAPTLIGAVHTWRGEVSAGTQGL